MSDAYWRYDDARQPPPTSFLVGKRPRSEYDAPVERNTPTYYPRDDDRGAHRTIIDAESINASYDRYLRSGQFSSHGGTESSSPLSGGLSSHSMEDPHLGIDPRVGGNHHLGTDPRIGNDPRISCTDPMMATKGPNSSLGSGRPEVPLPPDASSTLYVEGLPSNCTVEKWPVSFEFTLLEKDNILHLVSLTCFADIFRPFVGYQEVRLVTKDPKHPGGIPVVLCFVDFASPAHAATALDALQGYKFDEYDRESAVLRLQFARYPGARSSGGGHRAKR